MAELSYSLRCRFRRGYLPAFYAAYALSLVGWRRPLNLWCDWFIVVVCDDRSGNA